MQAFRMCCTMSLCCPTHCTMAAWLPHTAHSIPHLLEGAKTYHTALWKGTRCRAPRAISSSRQAAVQEPKLKGRSQGAVHSLKGAMLCHALLEGHTLQGAACHQLKGALPHPNEAHAVMQAPRAQAPLRNLEAPPLTQQHAADRHTHVLQGSRTTDLKAVPF